MPIDGTIIQKKVWYGYRIAGSKVGVPHDLYRPVPQSSPLDLLNRLGSVPVALDAKPSYKFEIPSNHGDWERYALVDGAVVKRGDYLVGPAETVFIANMQPLMPIICAVCNATISLRRVSDGPGFGAIEDRSDVSTQESEIFGNWPVSMLFGGRGRAGAGGIPGDQSDPDYMIIMPAIPWVAEPRSGDVVVDQAGRRFAVGWWESSPLGWRMLARLLTAG